MAFAAGLRRLSPRTLSRNLSISSVARAEVAPVAVPVANVGTAAPAKKPVGGVRGGIVGFLFGFSFAASLGVYSLLQEYQQATLVLQQSIAELQANTEKVSAHVQRLEAAEKNLKALSTSSATKDELSRVRAEAKKLYDGLHVELLDLRTHTWGIQKDLHSLTKKDASTVRI